MYKSKIEYLIDKYEFIVNNYRAKAKLHIENNSELYHRFRLRADELDSVIMDLKELLKYCL